MTDHASPADIAVAFLDAWVGQDRAAMARYLADDITFESPQVRLTGAEAVLAAMEQFAQVVVAVKKIAVFGDDKEALVMYDMETGPFGTLRAADHLVVQDGKIKSDKLVFDTYEVRRAGAQQATSS